MSVPDNDVQGNQMIGRRLRDLRVGMSLTQTEVAERVGLTQGRVSMLERGSTLNPIYLFRLARLYGTTADYVIAGVVPDQQSAA